MPLYDYECRTCGRVTEVRHGFDESYSGKCPDCQQPLVRKFNAAPIVFKGSGFYVTDSRKGSSANGSSSSSGKSESSTTKAGESGTKAESSARTESGTKSESGAKSDAGGKSEAAA